MSDAACDYDVLVIGAGPAGYVAAIRAAFRAQGLISTSEFPALGADASGHVVFASGYLHGCKLHNLEALPADGFEVACFSAKIRRGPADWTRAVSCPDPPILAAVKRFYAATGRGADGLG